jgi:maleate isomerase
VSEDVTDLAFDLDSGAGARARLGLVVLQTDETIEVEFGHLVNISDVALYHSRIPMVPEISKHSLAQMKTAIPNAVKLFPATAKLDVLGYGCTSAATVIGPAKIHEAIHAVCPGARVTDPISAVVAACKALSAQKIGFITPYVAETMRAFLATKDITVQEFASFNEMDDRRVACITPSTILAAIETVAARRVCDLVFVSCTNLRVAAIAEKAEKQVGVPVISSNTALAWHMLRLAGIDDSVHGFGRLLRI